MKRKWKALGIAALLLLTGGTVWAFSEVSLLVQAVKGRCKTGGIHQGKGKTGSLERKSDGTSRRRGIENCQNFQ